MQNRYLVVNKEESFMERRFGINFDRFVKRFHKNIYGSDKGRIRQQIVWQHMLELLPLQSATPLTILDLGCGTAPFAEQLLELGHSLTLADMSADMLQQASQRLYTHVNADRIVYVHSPLQTLPDQLAGKQYDIIMAHAVIEWLPENESLLDVVAKLLKPQGYLSLLFYNRNSLLFRNMQLGNWKRVKFGWLRGRGKKTLTPTNPQDPYELYEQLKQWHLIPIGKAGVRVFYDYLDRSTDKSNLALLYEMEQRYSQQEPFVSLARYIHVVCCKDATA